MSTFQFDTSGSVYGEFPTAAGTNAARFIAWSDLSHFVQGFAEAAFASLPATFAPFMLRGMSYGNVLQQMRATGCAGRRNHWCAPVLIYQGTRLVLDDEGEARPWKANADDRRATDWEMIAREDAPKPPAFSDLAPETLAAMIRDCEAFLAAKRGFDEAEHGRRFWLYRNQPRAADWPADFPPLTLSLGDDGKVYAREAS